MQENKLLITSEIHEWLRWKVVFAQWQLKCSARLPLVALNVARWSSWPRSSSIKHLLTLHHAGDGCLSALACLINHILGPGSLVQRLGFWLCCCFTNWSVYWNIEDRIDCIKPLHFKYVGQVDWLAVCSESAPQHWDVVWLETVTQHRKVVDSIPKADPFLSACCLSGFCPGTRLIDSSGLSVEVFVCLSSGEKF